MLKPPLPTESWLDGNNEEEKIMMLQIFKCSYLFVEQNHLRETQALVPETLAFFLLAEKIF